MWIVVITGGSFHGDSIYRHRSGQTACRKLRFENGGIGVSKDLGVGLEFDPEKLAKYHELSKNQSIGLGSKTGSGRPIVRAEG